jgi:hypothetical protein
MNAQKNGPVVSAIIVAAGCVIGAAMATPLTHLMSFNNRGVYPASHVIFDIAVCAAGALLGGLFFSWAGKR